MARRAIEEGRWIERIEDVLVLRALRHETHWVEVLGGPDGEALVRGLVDEDWRARGVETATRIGEVFAHALLRGDTGEPFESIEHAFREHGDAVRGEDDDEQPWNAATPLSGAEIRVEVCLAEARYVERRVPFVDLPGSVRRAKAAVDAGDESGWTPVADGPVFRYVRALREDGAGNGNVGASASGTVDLPEQSITVQVFLPKAPDGTVQATAEPFWASVQFSVPVTGFGTDDVEVTPAATVTEVGRGTDQYFVRIVPTDTTTARVYTVRIPANVVKEAATGNTNKASDDSGSDDSGTETDPTDPETDPETDPTTGGGGTPPANNAPAVAAALADRTLTAGEREEVSLGGAFTDADGDALTFGAVSSDPAAATAAVSGATLTLTAVAPGTATVTVTASDGRGGTARAPFTVTVEAREAVSLVLVESGGATAVDEDGGTDTWTVALAAEPTASVTVTVASGDEDAATVSPARLTFTTDNWNTPQTVTATGVQDDDALDETVEVTLTPAGASEYAALSPATVEVDVTDDDEAALALSALSVAVREGADAAWTVALATEPSAAVTVAVASADAAIATVSPARLVFTAADWRTPQTVTATGVADDDTLDETVEVTLTVTGAAEYAALSPAAVMVEVAETDAALVKAAVKQTLAAVARRALTSALDNIGARLAASVPASGLTLAGARVALDGDGRAVDSYGACAADGFGRHTFGSATDGCGGARSIGAGALLGGSAFSLNLSATPGAPESDPQAPQWSVWGRGDLGGFEGRPAPGMGYEGELRTGWLGMDARAGPWVAGLAVSHGTGEADYGADGAEEGRLETTLTALYPYGRWTLAEGLELRGVLGAGTGAARHRPDGAAARETSDLTMYMASLGFRQALPALAGLDLAARGDASLARIESGDGPQYVDGLSADSTRARLGLEATRRVALDSDTALTPFVEAAVRRDGGDGLTGTGLEVAGGLRYTAPRLQVEARGRWLAAHTEDGAEERGVSVTARMGPGAHGRGLSLALAPRWGADTGGAGALWRDEMPRLDGAADGDDDTALDARIGYGVSLAPRGLLTPFAEAGLAGGEDRLKLGTRFEATHMNLGVELAGERREGAAGPEHALRLDLGLRF